MRLIDAKAFDLRVSQKKMTEVFPNWKELPMEVQDAVCKHAQHLHMLLETQHTVDAVEVVRCKDCKHSYGNKYCTNDAWKDDGNTVHIEPDDFCSYGERKEAGHGETH